jgi:thioredoxin 1
VENKGIIVYRRIGAIIAVILVVMIVVLVKSKRDKISRNEVYDSNSRVEASTIEMTDLPVDTTSESTFIGIVHPDTVSGNKVEDRACITETNPLEQAFRENLPTVADFGRGTCIPCKMMQPILEKLARDFKGKASIVFLDIREYAALSQKYRITLIPTQIFFDAQGEEVCRHQGFMSEGDIVAQLEKMGVK